MIKDLFLLSQIVKHLVLNLNKNILVIQELVIQMIQDLTLPYPTVRLLVQYHNKSILVIQGIVVKIVKEALEA